MQSPVGMFNIPAATLGRSGLALWNLGSNWFTFEAVSRLLTALGYHLEVIPCASLPNHLVGDLISSFLKISAQKAFTKGFGRSSEVSSATPSTDGKAITHGSSIQLGTDWLL